MICSHRTLSLSYQTTVSSQKQISWIKFYLFYKKIF
jgi:hypothetical protein